MIDNNTDTIMKYLILTLMKGVGPVTQNALLDVCPDIDRWFEVEQDEDVISEASAIIGMKQIDRILGQRKNEDIRVHAEDILEKCSVSGIDIITRDDSAYPKRFCNIADMPILLYTKGELKINRFEKSVGVVGARRCSREGREAAIDIAERLVDEGTAVISGMAKGIDSYAHTAVIKKRGYTIAVLGCGVDICYPKEHARLYEEINIHGCIISEYPPGTSPRGYLFPRRNRLIAALSDEVYVIDAGRNSGANLTVGYCEKYGKKIRKYA